MVLCRCIIIKTSKQECAIFTNHVQPNLISDDGCMFDVAVVCDVTTLDVDVAATEFACGGEIVGC